MKLRILGKTGLRVSEICLGTMTFGEAWGFGASPAESRKIFDAFVNAGGNFFDTANLYTSGESESILGDCIAADRTRHVIATKYTCSTDPKEPNRSGSQRKNLVHSLEDSLRRLKTDYVDLLWVHAYDPYTSTEELLRSLHHIVASGKALHIGVSDTPAWIVARANTLAEERGLTPFCAIQTEYSLIERTPERDLIPMADALGLSVTAWGPLGGGVLSGKYTKDGVTDSKRQRTNQTRLTERNLAIARAVGEVAKDLNTTSVAVALRWLLDQSENILPIVGARTKEQLESSLACFSVDLTSEHRKRLQEVSAVDLGFPHDFLRSAAIRRIIFGETEGRIR